MSLLRWVLLVALTAASCLAVYGVHALRENSLAPILIVSILSAATLSIGLLGAAILALRDLVIPRSRRAAATAEPAPAEFQPPSPQAWSAESASSAADRAKERINLINMTAIGSLFTAILVYFPIKRFLQILAPTSLWIAAAGISVVGTSVLAAHVLLRLRAGLKRPSSLAGMLALWLVALAVWSATAIRMLNAPLGFLKTPSSQSGTIATLDVTRGWRQMYPTYAVRVRLESAKLILFSVSRDTFRSLKTGDGVTVHVRAGMLGLPWCLGDCL